jgi:hypothetical protein
MPFLWHVGADPSDVILSPGGGVPVPGQHCAAGEAVQLGCWRWRALAALWRHPTHGMHSTVLAVFGGFRGEHAMPSTSASRWIELGARILNEGAEPWDARRTAETTVGGRWEQEGGGDAKSVAECGVENSEHLYFWQCIKECGAAVPLPVTSISPCPVLIFLQRLFIPVTPR